MATLTFSLVLSGHPHSYKWVKEQKESNEFGSNESTEAGPWKLRGEAIQFLFWLENFAPLSTFCHVLWNSNNLPPPCPPPRELLLPQDIPEMHSRGVGQLGGWGEDRGQRSNPSKEWNVSVLGVRNLGDIENTVRADIHKGSCRETGSYREGQRERES